MFDLTTERPFDTLIPPERTHVRVTLCSYGVASQDRDPVGVRCQDPGNGEACGSTTKARQGSRVTGQKSRKEPAP